MRYELRSVKVGLQFCQLQQNKWPYDDYCFQRRIVVARSSNKVGYDRVVFSALPRVSCSMLPVVFVRSFLKNQLQLKILRDSGARCRPYLGCLRVILSIALSSCLRQSTIHLTSLPHHTVLLYNEAVVGFFWIIRCLFTGRNVRVLHNGIILKLHISSSAHGRACVRPVYKPPWFTNKK